jgi:H/ACA ribonucleoprotein complex subunit 3
MSHLLFRCDSCGSYSLGSTCPKCNGATSNPHPQKYSPEDKLAKYRRLEKFGASTDSALTRGD